MENINKSKYSYKPVIGIITFFVFLIAYEFGSRILIYPMLPSPQNDAWLNEFILGALITIWLQKCFKENIISIIVAAILPIILLLGFDAYYQVFYESPKLHQLTPWVLIKSWQDLPIELCISLAVTLIIIIISISYKLKTIAYALSLPIAFIGITFFNSFALSNLQNIDGGEEQYWNNFSFNSNGRLVTIAHNQSLYYHRNKLLENTTNTIWNKQFESVKSDIISSNRISGIESLPNIYVYLLESHFDFDNLDVNSEIKQFNKEFETFIQPNMGDAIPPVVGGGSVNSEFELLCGVPSKRIISLWDFTLMRSMKNPDCMMMNLKNIGYKTRVHHGGNPFEYDSGLIYSKIGFEQAYFTSTSFFNGDYQNSDPKFHISDLELSDQMIILNKDQKTESPVFNYILGKYGHSPFDINKESYPPLKWAHEQPEHLVEKLINQEFYRQEFINHIIRNIEKNDPNNLIIITGDHTPALMGSRTKVFINEKSAPLLVKYKGQWHKYNNVPIFQIYQVVFDLITGGGFCKQHLCWTNQDRKSQVAQKLYLSFFSSVR